MADTRAADRVHVADEMPPESERRVWCHWLRRHSVDPNDVAIPGWIERDERWREITYLAYKLDTNGDIIVKPDRSDVERVVRVVQLEAAPAPFPTFEEETDRG